MTFHTTRNINKLTMDDTFEKKLHLNPFIIIKMTDNVYNFNFCLITKVIFGLTYLLENL